MIVLVHLDLLSCFQWMICYLLRQTYAHLQLLKDHKKDLFTAKNDSQMFFARDLSIVFAEVNLLYLYYLNLCLCLINTKSIFST